MWDLGLCNRYQSFEELLEVTIRGAVEDLKAQVYRDALDCLICGMEDI